MAMSQRFTPKRQVATSKQKAVDQWLMADGRLTLAL